MLAHTYIHTSIAQLSKYIFKLFTTVILFYYFTVFLFLYLLKLFIVDHVGDHATLLFFNIFKPDKIYMHSEL